jgi:hypothetical protein
LLARRSFIRSFTSIFFAYFRTSTLFSSVTDNTPFLKPAAILSVSMPSTPTATLAGGP